MLKRSETQRHLRDRKRRRETKRGEKQSKKKEEMCVFFRAKLGILQ